MTERQIIDGLGYYPAPNGSLYPSVTTVLSETKSEADKLALAKWRKSVGEEKAQEGATRGTEIHTLCENFFDIQSGLYVEEKAIEISELASPYWENMKHLLRRTSPLLVEEFVYHDNLKYAGRFDCYGRFDDRHNLVIDFKTSGKPKQAKWIQDYFIQATAYAMAIEHTLNLPVDGIAILMASPERPQVFHLDKPEIIQYEKLWIDRLNAFHSTHTI